MPGRIVPLITDQVYHIFNRGIDKRPTFTERREYQRAYESIKFYRINKPPLSLSKFLRVNDKQKKQITSILGKSEKLVEILAYCLMPNHFHFLLRQLRDNGIARFLSNFQNSFTRYFNIRHKRDGPLFLDQFKALRIEDDEQLVHVSRYIHLNPYTGFVVKDISGLTTYPWSSLPDYISPKSDSMLGKNLILENFRSPREYKKFVFDQADYQRKLKEIEHLIFE